MDAAIWDAFPLIQRVCAAHDLPAPSSSHLLRSYTNDVYEVRFPEGERAILKIYGSEWRTRDALRCEIALLRHLQARGAPVVPPLSSGSGSDPLHSVVTPQGIRYVALFEYDPGEKPAPPFSLELYEVFGRVVAQMHELSTGFQCSYYRPPLNLTTLVDIPLKRIVPLLSQQDDKSFLTTLADRIHQALTTLEAEGLDFGPVHGDATLDNLHVRADGSVVLYDFDSGGPGWRAMDLQGWAAITPPYWERWEAFQRGYATVRPLRPPDLQAAPWLTIATDIWGIGIDLERRVLAQGSEAVAAYLRESLNRLRERDQNLALWCGTMEP